MKAGAQHRVEHGVAAAEQNVELVARGADDVDDARLDGGLRHHAGKIAAELVGLAGRHDAHVDARGLELLGGDPAVSAVVAKSGKHHGARDVAQAQDLLRGSGTGAVHELRDANAGVGQTGLDGADVLDIQYRLHAQLTFRP